jgi:signal transduction histidine kinase
MQPRPDFSFFPISSLPFSPLPPCDGRFHGALGSKRRTHPTETIEGALEAARRGLEMEVAYVGELAGDDEVFQAVAGKLEGLEFAEGDAIPRSDGLCERLCDGRIPHVVPDVAQAPELAALEFARRARVGAYVGVPLRLSDGRLHGALCCISRQAAPAVGEREVRYLGVLGSVVAREIERDVRKDDFVALVSHELRTPLATIIANLEVLEDETEGLSSDGQHFVGAIDRNARRLLRLVGQLLFVSQLQAGTLPARRSWVDLQERVRDALDLARPAAAARQVGLEPTLAPVGRVWADVDRIAQLLDGLLSNAIKFTPAGGVVRLRLIRTERGLRVEVRDTGTGIPEEEQERVFERFYRGRDAVEREVGGAGLGLWICDAIVGMHGGTIAISSSPGVGTAVTVELPFAG